MIEQTCFDKMLEWHQIAPFQTKEGSKVGPASNSELRRWFKNKVVQINGKAIAATDPYPSDVWEITFFPRNKNQKCSYFWVPENERA